MKFEIFAIRDRQLAAYMQPWPAQTIGQATRMFTDEINNRDSTIHKHPNDYDAYHIGAFDTDTGKLTQNDNQPMQICIGANVTEA